MTKNRVAIFAALGMFFLIIFLGFSYWVKTGAMRQSDFNLTLKTEGQVPRSLDGALSVLSLAGSFEVTTFILVMILIWRKKWPGVVAFGIYALGMGVELLGKSFLPHPSPPFMFYRYHVEIPFIFPSAYVHTNYSYPSGHAYRAVFIMLFAAWLVWRNTDMDKRVKIMWLTGLGLGLGVVLFSRVSLGEHWPSDVIGGTLVGLAMGWMAIAASERLQTVKLPSWPAKH